MRVKTPAEPEVDRLRGRERGSGKGRGKGHSPILLTGAGAMPSPQWQYRRPVAAQSSREVGLAGAEESMMESVVGELPGVAEGR